MVESVTHQDVPNAPPPKEETCVPLNDEKNGGNSSPSKALLGLTFLLLIGGLAWFAYWHFDLQYHETTDDAYANGNYLNINSVIKGAVISYYADDTNLVKEGQLLVQLDPTNYQAIYEKELAALAQVALGVKQIYNNVRALIAEVKHQRIVLDRMQFNYDNRLKLKESNPEAISEEDYVHSQQYVLEAQYSLQQIEFKLAAAFALAGNRSPEHHPLIEKQKAIVISAYYDLSHCSIYAPQTGYIAQRIVDIGQWITPETNLMAIIPIDYMWVDANFKETQLGKIRIGQPATVTFDLYGSDVIFRGKVMGIASGTGSVFSLIPPQNATGNWIKIVQRLPVRISLDKEMRDQFPIRLGISANVDVDVSNQDLPLLALHPPKKEIANTSVYDIHLEKVNQLMEKIILDNLALDESKIKQMMNKDAKKSDFSKQMEF
ncbi:MAG: HlyD family efflux transporter periplasmic adaptor subunit [Parachlamydiaceae bacterium]